MIKPLWISAVLVVGLTMGGQAQVKKKAIETITISTPGIQSEPCKLLVENYMAKEEGVTKTVVDYKKHTVKVSFWNDRSNAENIKTAIANAGFDADDVKAEPSAYARLPKGCKRPEDGGPPAPKKQTL
jgi:periplasmic mercuric ion binding protein